MGLHENKYQTCPLDEDEAILLVDVETEMTPVTDENGNVQYYCEAGQHTFSVDEDGWFIQGNSQQRR